LLSFKTKRKRDRRSTRGTALAAKLITRRLHRAAQRVADRHRGPGQIAENTLVFGQEPGRDSRDEWALLLAAIAYFRLIAARWRLHGLPWRLWRRVRSDRDRLDRQRLAVVRFGLLPRPLLRFLRSARRGGWRRFRKRWS